MVRAASFLRGARKNAAFQFSTGGRSKYMRSRIFERSRGVAGSCGQLGLDDRGLACLDDPASNGTATDTKLGGSDFEGNKHVVLGAPGLADLCNAPSATASYILAHLGKSPAETAAALFGLRWFSGTLSRLNHGFARQGGL
jgi:hypothetical protein